MRRSSGVLIVQFAAMVFAVSAEGQTASHRLVQVERVNDFLNGVPLGPVGRVIATSEYGLIVSQPTACSVLVVDLERGRSRSIGTCGDEAGQFRELADVGMLDGKLWAWDQQNHRLTFLDLPSAAPVRTVRLDLSRATFPDHDAPTVTSVHADDSFTLRWGARVRPLSNSQELQHELLIRRHRSGKAADSLRVTGPPRAIAVRRDDDGRSGVLITSPLFPVSSVVLMNSWGTGGVVVERSSPVRSGRVGIRVSSFDGGFNRTATTVVPFASIGLPKEKGERLVASRIVELETQRGISIPASLRSRLQTALRPPAHIPPVTDVVLGGDGVVWLKLAQEYSGAGLWYAVDVVKQRYRVLQPPVDITVLESRGADVWAVTRVERDGAIQLMRYQIVPGR